NVRPVGNRPHGRKPMRRLLALAILLFAYRPLAESALQPPTEDERLADYFKAYLDAETKLRPLEATRLGDHRYDHLLDDVSAAARAANTERVRRTLAELPKRIDYGKLSRGGQID